MFTRSVSLVFFCSSLAIAQGYPKHSLCNFGSTTTVEHDAD